MIISIYSLINTVLFIPVVFLEIFFAVLLNKYNLISIGKYSDPYTPKLVNHNKEKIKKLDQGLEKKHKSLLSNQEEGK